MWCNSFPAILELSNPLSVVQCDCVPQGFGDWKADPCSKWSIARAQSVAALEWGQTSAVPFGRGQTCSRMQADTRMHASFFSSNLLYEQILVYEGYLRARNNWSLVFCCMCMLSWESVLGKVPRRRHERGQHLLVFGCTLSTVSVLFSRDHRLTARIAAASVAASTCSSRGFNAFWVGGRLCGCLCQVRCWCVQLWWGQSRGHQGQPGPWITICSIWSAAKGQRRAEPFPKQTAVPAIPVIG